MSRTVRMTCEDLKQPVFDGALLIMQGISEYKAKAHDMVTMHVEAMSLDTESKFDDEKSVEEPLFKYLCIAMIAIGMLASPQSRFHDQLKMSAWTLIVLGAYSPYM